MEGHMLSNVNDNRGMTFDVDETLFFEKGQGISEMMSISLEPDILVQSYNDYVQVRGLIILQGEYRKENVVEESIPPLHSNQNIKYIEKVLNLEDGIASFSHRIPVEVSIPTYRVDNIKDIMVVVESFDYELPNQHVLKVHSSLLIYGIKDAEQVVSTEDLVIEEKPKKEEIGKEMEVTNESMTTNENHSSSSHKVEVNSDNRKNFSKQQVQDIENQTEVEEQSNPDVEGEVKESVDKKMDGEEIDIQLKENIHKEDDMEENNKDVLFLTEFFAEEEEDTYTKLKIHITQEDDTIESIAKRYEIPTIKLMQDNNLTNYQLEEGQLLNIG